MVPTGAEAEPWPSRPIHVNHDQGGERAMTARAITPRGRPMPATALTPRSPGRNPSPVTGRQMLALAMSLRARGLRGLDVLRRSRDRAPPFS